MASRRRKRKADATDGLFGVVVLFFGPSGFVVGKDLRYEASPKGGLLCAISDEIRISLEKVERDADNETQESSDRPDKLTTSKLAQKLGVKTNELIEKLVSVGYLEMREGKTYITAKGKEAGGEFRMSSKFGPYFLWPEKLPVK